MSISNHISSVCNRLRDAEFTSEAEVSQGILLPTLQSLGWPVFDTSIVTPEFSIKGRRVDFALCHPKSRPVVYIEAKKVGKMEGADRQLFEYAFHSGVPMAILTDGRKWSFYLPGEQGEYHERCVYQFDLLSCEIEEVIDRLQKYLNYEKVCSGEALKSARTDYEYIVRGREIEAVLPKAWNDLLDEQHAQLLSHLAEKVENFCGYKPDLNICNAFLNDTLNHDGPAILPSLTNPSQQKASSIPKQKPSNFTKEVKRPKAKEKRTVEKFSFVFDGKTYHSGTARGVMVKIFQLLADKDSGFLERFASKKHGKKRRYIAQNEMDLYPGNPNLLKVHSVEFVPGWWIGTNYSRRDLQKIMNLAFEDLPPKLRSSIKVNVE